MDPQISGLGSCRPSPALHIPIQIYSHSVKEFPGFEKSTQAQILVIMIIDLGFPESWIQDP